MMSPTSSPSTNLGSIPDVYALVLLERERGMTERKRYLAMRF